jgi:hypothetical protein
MKISTDQLSRIAGRQVVVSISTGKDSVAASLWLTENGVAHDRIFLDTRNVSPGEGNAMASGMSEPARRTVP